MKRSRSGLIVRSSVETTQRLGLNAKRHIGSCQSERLVKRLPDRVERPRFDLRQIARELVQERRFAITTKLVTTIT
jgi:hypothetical protein